MLGSGTARSAVCPASFLRRGCAAKHRLLWHGPRSSKEVNSLPSLWSGSQGIRPFEKSSPQFKSSFQTYSNKVPSFRDSFHFSPSSHSFADIKPNLVDEEVVLNGWLGRQVKMSKKLSFAQLLDPEFRFSLQLVANGDLPAVDVEPWAPQSDGVAEPPSPLDVLTSLNESTPVSVRGIVRRRNPSKKEAFDGTRRIDDVEVELHEIRALNSFPEDLVKFTKDVAPTATERHLQIRLDPKLRSALIMRDRAARICGSVLRRQRFQEVETPLLFKSTPEGAREYLVPTREKGLAYALPQSPQQYKQILISGGISRYFQVAKCFRDEDLRADRQPEFTQLDLEMAFATGREVKEIVEQIIYALWSTLLDIKVKRPFSRITYEDAMSKYGYDKPDRRLGMEIHRVDYLLPADLVSKMTPLTSPIVDMLVLRGFDRPRDTQGFVQAFMDSKEASDAGVLKNPDGQPGIFIFNSEKPLSGLQALGFEAAEVLEGKFDLKHGDLIVMQARTNERFSGESTALGRIRLALYRDAVAKGILPAAREFDFLWVEDFPMFKLNDADPGQGGSSGFSSTHHPFTAPKTLEDIDRLETDPTTALSEHYDLVVNGVELGGGSRRVHDAVFQEYILRDILKMSEAGIEGFQHLLEALRAGCPPHAGIALGFDRLVAVLTGNTSIRDVMAFPKNGSGEDILVKSPGKLSSQQLDTYHLALKD